MSDRFRTLEYEVVGEGEPLLFLGNLATSTAGMRAFAPLLESAGCQLVLVDDQSTEDTTVEAAAAGLGELLDHLGSEPWVWGYSQGACVAQELALARPDRVRGVVLVATRGRLSRFLTHYLRASGELGGAGPGVAAVFTCLATLTPDQLADDDQMDFLLRTHHLADPAREARSLRASAAYDNRLTALGAMRVPGHVVSFSGDAVCPPRLGREVADAIPDCEHTEIEGAGHGGLVTHATEVLDVVIDFIQRRRDNRA